MNHISQPHILPYYTRTPKHEPHATNTKLADHRPIPFRTATTMNIPTKTLTLQRLLQTTSHDVICKPFHHQTVASRFSIATPPRRYNTLKHELKRSQDFHSQKPTVNRQRSSKMVKDTETVIEYTTTFHPSPHMTIILTTPPREFNELVNMTASDLETWLKSDDSTGAGWSKDDGSGETIGHERLVGLLIFSIS